MIGIVDFCGKDMQESKDIGLGFSLVLVSENIETYTFANIMINM